MEPTPPPQGPLVNIMGEKVALGPVRRDLLPLYMRWFNDFEVTRTLLSVRPRPTTWQAEEAWVEGVSRNDRDVFFTIYESTTLRPIGNTDLHDIDYFHRTAEFGIMIGEKDCWGRGYGTEATTLMLDYAFTTLGLHNIMLRAYSFNERGLRAYTRAGFREFGRRHEVWRPGGQVCEIVYMESLATAFQRPVLHRLLDQQPEIQP